jgi:cytoskeleton protein RodZ
LNDIAPELEAAPPTATAGDRPEPGARLRAAREALGLTVSDVARNLRLSPVQVEALERDDHARLPGPVFVRGFLRNYARLVKVDPEAVVASQPPLSPAVLVVPDVPPAVGAAFSAGHNFTWMRYALIALVPVVIIGLYLMYDDGQDTVAPPSAVLVPPALEPADGKAGSDAQSLPAPATTATAPGEPPATPVTEAAKPAATPPVANIAAGAGEAPVVSVKRKPGDHVVRLLFDQDSWVEIRDRDGNRIYSQLNAAGTSQTISGTPPLQLIIGNAAGVRMTVNDRPYDLAPYVKVDVARLTLD